MKGLAFHDYSNPVPGRGLALDGDLKFIQRDGLNVRSSYGALYNDDPLLGLQRSASFNDAAYTEIIQRYQERNMSTFYDVRYPLWVPRPPTGALDSAGVSASDFQLNVTVRVPYETFTYVPEATELLKFAWVQYLALLWLMLRIADVLKWMVYSNHVISTTVVYNGAYRGPKQHSF